MAQRENIRNRVRQINPQMAAIEAAIDKALREYGVTLGVSLTENMAHDEAMALLTRILDLPHEQVRVVDVSRCRSQEEIEFELYCNYLQAGYTEEAAAKAASDEAGDIWSLMIKDMITRHGDKIDN